MKAKATRPVTSNSPFKSTIRKKTTRDSSKHKTYTNHIQLLFC